MSLCRRPIHRWFLMIVLLVGLPTSASTGQVPRTLPAIPPGLRPSAWQAGHSQLPQSSPLQEAYLKASNAGMYDGFGASVAVDGDTVVVGAAGEASSSTGVNSTPNEAAIRAGAAYVFVRTGSTWTQQAYLKASTTAAEASFGASVAVSGNTIVIGARDQGAGIVYVFVRTGTTWTEQATLTASNAQAGDQFGHSVAIRDDTVVVGAWSEDSSTTGVNSVPNEAANGAGAAYVFVRSAPQGTPVWTQQAYLKASNAGAYHAFGFSVAVDRDTLVVGAMGEPSSTRGVNTIPNDAADGSGAAYIFGRSGAQGAPAWAEQAYLKASNADRGDSFGTSVAVSGDTVVVGAWAEDSSSAGVNSVPNEATSAAGAAYVFVRAPATAGAADWTEQAYLKAANPGVNDYFGNSVAVDGATVVVGGPGEDSSTSGINTSPNQDAPQAGAAYIFTRADQPQGPPLWTQQVYLKASNTEAWDGFGSVAIAGATVVVGAMMEDSSTSGVNTIPNNNAQIAGATYVFNNLPVLTHAVQRYLPMLTKTAGHE